MLLYWVILNFGSILPYEIAVAAVQNITDIFFIELIFTKACKNGAQKKQTEVCSMYLNL